MQHNVKILSITNLTNDVLKIVTEKPANYVYNPGQATDVSVNRDEWKDQLRAFTFTSLADDDHLEFTIKTYPARKGVTNQLLELTRSKELIVHDAFGDITYKGEGLFIAGGAGVTPFIAIFRNLEKKNRVGNNKLIFANKTKDDIIQEAWFRRLLGPNFINVLSFDNIKGYAHGYIDEELLKAHIRPGQKIYLCGPPPMMESVQKILSNFGINQSDIIKEGF